jgi:hypothetical protein
VAHSFCNNTSFIHSKLILEKAQLIENDDMNDGFYETGREENE